MKIEPNVSELAPATPDHLAYRRDIDGLRAVAVLSVLAFHAFPDTFRGGFIGVDLFFVISGFLISSIIVKDLGTARFTFSNFYARRIKRIFPALILVMSACLAFGWFALFPDEFAQLGKHVAGGSGFVANLMFWQEVGYFDTAAETKPLLHLWSLGIEEQFYIVWPVVLLLAWKRGFNLLAVTAALAAVSFLINVAGLASYPSATFYSPASRAWELMLGAMLGCLSVQAGALAAVQARVSPALQSGAALLLLVAGLALITAEQPFPGFVALLPVASALLFISAGPQTWINRVLLSNRLMVWVGLISYPLYLWHWPLLSFARIIESNTPSATIRGAALLGAFVLAWLTWRLLEVPLRHARSRLVTIGLTVLMLVLAGVGLSVLLKQGLPERASIVENARHHQSLILVEDKANAAACKQRYGFDSMYEYCQLANIDQDPSVVLIGDSHGYHVLAGLTKYYSERGENLLLLGTRHPYWGLPPGDDPYQAATQQMLELALNTPSVKTVVFSTHVRLSDADPAAQAIVDAARATFRRFTEAGKHVIFMTDIPILTFEPRACIKRAGITSSATRSPCSLPRSEVDAQTPRYDVMVKQLMAEFPQIELFETTPHMCDAQACHAIIDGQLMYRDKHHLSYEGDLYIGRKFAERPKHSKID
jgi:peptidoglycan/LPS O-acetylase OafA/YrhL